MSDTVSGLLTVGLLVLMLAVAYHPVGAWLAAVFTDTRHWRLERSVYRLVRVDADSEQGWRAYATSVVVFSVVGTVALFALVVAQTHLPGRQGSAGMGLTTALCTAVSFVTNTDWQSYAGEVGATPLLQTAGLAVQNFVSAAVGLAVAIALMRALARHSVATIGNFWVDLVRGVVRVLLPASLVAAVLLLAGGVIQNLNGPTTVKGLAGVAQVVRGGLVASQEAIKEIGTNGGGYFNANSAHPFENPNPLTNVFEIFLLLVIPFALTRTYGLVVGDRRQGWALAGFAGLLWAGGVAVTTWAEVHAAGAVTGSMEGKEQRFGVWGSTLFAASTTSTSTGSVNSMHESYSPLGGGTLVANMVLGEISPGGVGSGLYGIVIVALLAVFVAGLMVGRTPEYLGKAIGRREVTCAALYVLVMPALVLVGTGLSLAMDGPRAGMLASGPRGLTEVLYAYASAANNNGSAFAGLGADTPWYNLTLALCMLLGRFVPMVLVLRLCGLLVEQRNRPASLGTMPTHTPLFVGLVTGVAVILAGLTFFPALALGPLAEALS
ncbi:K+-transporting ATPase ATPase A chain [Phycicoccus badiiscoriae]|uniref:Potassium-transporting ATPase potassium-binding subunit n=1 Tax=Pedococcus badiiscoriae TaxID=642776 RepID=A0A852WMQ0_9MICO|nr:potassium-transporting ATPase subunit KdpA [Pedococcus badiiscoriae]NYG06562.1 K+-transporting ATPase ATPase A chain [Pedococcus badiiscoriae]